MPMPNLPSSTGGLEDFGKRFDNPHYEKFQTKDSLASLKAEAHSKIDYQQYEEEQKRLAEELKATDSKKDVAGKEASKQLGQIHAYLNEHFPQETGKGKTVAEMVLSILGFYVNLK